MNDKTRKIAIVGVMSALASVLMMLDFPIGLVPGFIKFDFSDVPALMTAFALGPAWGCIVSLIKNLVNVVVTQSAGIGELSNLAMSVSLVLPAGLAYKYLPRKKGSLVISSVIGTACMAAISVPVNYFVVFPFYSAAYGMPIEVIIGAFEALYAPVDNLLKVILIVMVPFNLFKGAVATALGAIIYNRLNPIIFKKNS